MNTLDFYKEQYYKELERSNGISNSFGTPVTIVSLLVGGIYYSITSFYLIEPVSMQIVFGIVIVTTVILLVKSLYHLIKAIANFKRGYDFYLLPNADELSKFQTDLEKNGSKALNPPAIKIQNVSHNPKQDKIFENNFSDHSKKNFEDYIIEVYVKCIAKNQENNDIKLYQRFLCIRYLSFSIVSICLLIIPMSNKKSEPEMKKIEIISPTKLKLEIREY